MTRTKVNTTHEKKEENEIMRWNLGKTIGIAPKGEEGGGRKAKKKEDPSGDKGFHGNQTLGPTTEKKN